MTLLVVRMLLVIGLLCAGSVWAVADENKLIKLNNRPGISVAFYYMKRGGARATVVLLPGGGGGIGLIGLRGGTPTSKNFLVRTRDDFAARNLNVAVVNRPSNRALDYEFRISAEHIHDLRRVVSYVKKDTGLPVWLVGTSRGTISVTAAAIAFGSDDLAGFVLTSSVTNRQKTGAVPAQDLAAIRIPVLILHHEKDACVVTKATEVPSITSGLKNVRVKKQFLVTGGGDPNGDPCGASHWHGFVGMEKEAVNIIVDWIKNPKP